MAEDYAAALSDAFLQKGQDELVRCFMLHKRKSARFPRICDILEIWETRKGTPAALPDVAPAMSAQERKTISSAICAALRGNAKAREFMERRKKA